MWLQQFVDFDRINPKFLCKVPSFVLLPFPPQTTILLGRLNETLKAKSQKAAYVAQLPLKSIWIIRGEKKQSRR